jgi:hypothetical protein
MANIKPLSSLVFLMPSTTGVPRSRADRSTSRQAESGSRPGPTAIAPTLRPSSETWTVFGMSFSFTSLALRTIAISM